VALTPREVEEFMAADKVVPGRMGGGARRKMAWEKPAPDRYFWQAPLEIEAGRVGDLFLFANPNFARSWVFKLILRGEDVFRWDVRPLPGGHNNPPGRPVGYPGKVREAEHEHTWVEGLDLRCAQPLRGFESSDHRAIFEEFCRRTRVRVEPAYVAPEAFEQLEL
jgi:hypothetical protein